MSKNNTHTSENGVPEYNKKSPQTDTHNAGHFVYRLPPQAQQGGPSKQVAMQMFYQQRMQMQQ